MPSFVPKCSPLKPYTKPMVVSDQDDKPSRSSCDIRSLPPKDEERDLRECDVLRMQKDSNVLRPPIHHRK